MIDGLRFPPRHDPERAKLMKAEADLDRQTFEAVAQYHRASDDQRDKIKEQVTQLVNKQFDVRQQVRSLELKRLEEQLSGLRKAIDRRNKDRKEVVEKRVSELLGQPDDAGF